MSSEKVNFSLLEDILIKKRGFLEQIFNLTLNQETILLCDEKSEEHSIMFREMNDEKQNLIDMVINSDNLFQNLFESSTDDFSKNAEQYAPRIKALQDLIREVMDIDIKIRVQEQKNKDLIASQYPRTKIKTAKVSKGSLLKKYENNNKPKITE